MTMCLYSDTKWEDPGKIKQMEEWIEDQKATGGSEAGGEAGGGGGTGGGGSSRKERRPFPEEDHHHPFSGCFSDCFSGHQGDYEKEGW